MIYETLQFNTVVSIGNRVRFADKEYCEHLVNR